MVRAHDMLFYVSVARGHRANVITCNSTVNRCRQCSQINLFEIISCHFNRFQQCVVAVSGND